MCLTKIFSDSHPFLKWKKDPLYGNLYLSPKAVRKILPSKEKNGGKNRASEFHVNIRELQIGGRGGGKTT